jgi:hypothetical protein
VPNQIDPCPISPTGAEIPYSCHARSRPRACQKIDCQRFAVSLKAWSHAISVTRLISRSKKSARALLRGVLGDRVRETGVVLEVYEATIAVVFLPRTVKHLGLDLGMLRAGFARRGVQGWLRSCTKWLAWPNTKGTSSRARPRRSIS